MNTAREEAVTAPGCKNEFSAKEGVIKGKKVKEPFSKQSYENQPFTRGEK